MEGGNDSVASGEGPLALSEVFYYQELQNHSFACINSHILVWKHLGEGCDQLRGRFFTFSVQLKMQKIQIQITSKLNSNLKKALFVYTETA